MEESEKHVILKCIRKSQEPRIGMKYKEEEYEQEQGRTVVWPDTTATPPTLSAGDSFQDP